MDVLDMSAIDALRDLRDDGDDDLLAELIDLFLADAPQRMMALAAAIGGEDWDGVASWAHSLKGSCGSLGAMHMAELCTRLESMGRLADAPRSEAEVVYRELESQFALAGDALRRERAASR